MTFLPIVGRELRVAARRRGTYWLRTGVAAAVIAVSAWIFLVSFRATSRELAQRLFYTLTGGALLFCLTAGLRRTSDCLSEEKRDGTLGLLFLTDLKGYDVVLGKLASNALNAVYGLLAIVPVLAIPLLLGGITPGEFARIAVVLVNALFFSLCVGLFASALSRSARKSMATALLLVLLFVAGAPGLGEWLAWHANRQLANNGFLIPSVVFNYARALDAQFRVDPAPFYWSLGTIHGLGWLFLGLASVVAPRAWQDRPAGARVLRLRDVWLNWSYGSVAERKAYRTQLLDRNPFFWLAARVRLKPAWVWAVLGLLGCLWVWGIFKFKRDWFNEPIYVATALVLNSILKSWVASEAVSQLNEERKAGTLELLLSTPLSVREILRGQWLALQRQFLGPLVIILLAEIAMLLASVRGTATTGEGALWISLWAAGMAMLVADLVALYWLGMWQGLAARDPKRAYGGTVIRILVLPWIGYAGFLVLMSLAAFRLPASENWGYYLIGAWAGFGVLADVGFGYWARFKLLTEFRVAAAQRYEARATLWRRWFGSGGSVSARAPASGAPS